MLCATIALASSPPVKSRARIRNGYRAAVAARGVSADRDSGADLARRTRLVCGVAVHRMILDDRVDRPAGSAAAADALRENRLRAIALRCDVVARVRNVDGAAVSDAPVAANRDVKVCTGRMKRRWRRLRSEDIDRAVSAAAADALRNQSARVRAAVKIVPVSVTLTAPAGAAARAADSHVNRSGRRG